MRPRCSVTAEPVAALKVLSRAPTMNRLQHSGIAVGVAVYLAQLELGQDLYA